MNLSPDTNGSYPNGFTPVGSLVYFLAQASSDPGRTTALWRTDGSAAGTEEVLLPPEVQLSASTRWQMQGVGERLFFAASDPGHGLEPWVLDGMGARRIRDIAPGATGSIDYQIYSTDRLSAAVNGLYLFVANDGIEGPELWASDGTEAGTTRKSAIVPGAGTLGIPFQSVFSTRGVVAGHLAFVRWSAAGGNELWWSTATDLGATRLRTLNAETSAFFPARVTPFFDLPGISCSAPTGSRLVFSAETQSRMSGKVYGTDGTTPGTQVLATLLEEPLGVRRAGCTSTGSSALFYGLDGAAAALFVTGGEPSNTVVLGPLASEPPENLVPSDPPFVAFNGRWVGSTPTTWVETDLTPTGTSLTSLVISASSLAASDGLLWGLSFAAVLVGDGTPAGTIAVPPGDGAPLDSTNELGLVGGLPLFLGYRMATGEELWRSDGTSPGTGLLVELAPGPNSPFELTPWYSAGKSPSRRLLSLGSLAVMAVDDGIHGTELWRTDGTAAGTTLLKDIYPGSYPSTPRDLVRVGDRVYFAAEDELHGLELWVTDGTADGTHLVRDLVPGAESSVPQELTEVKGRLYFTAWRPAWGREPFQSDGTEAGTLQVADAWSGPESSSPSRFAAVRDTLYFAADDGTHGFELFKVIDPTLLDVFADGFESGSLGRWSRRSAP